MLCFKDPLCSSCNSNGKCTACHDNHKLASSGKCICTSIANCESCINDKNKCDKCDDGYKLNTVVSP